MPNLNSSSHPTPSRSTLTLKGEARKSSREPKAPPPSRTKNPAKFKPGARWSEG
jgi:hypothetical protein